MGELSDALKEFQEISGVYYQRIMNILEEKYCWKCPMRTNSKETLCREVESWIRLTESLEYGVKDVLHLNELSIANLEVICAKFLEKQIKSGTKREDSTIFKLDENFKPFAQSGDFLLVKTRPLRVKRNDLVLLPRACPIATYWYIKTMGKATVPFKIFKVSRVFQKKGCRYIQTNEGLELPVEFLIGVVRKIINQEDLSIKSG